jgi:hypothetical protein
MTSDELRTAVTAALEELNAQDRHLLQYDLSERCIASRLAMYLQPKCGEYVVDIEYNRAGDIPKRLALPDECANYRDKDGNTLVVPDLIVHKRGPDGPNVLVLELKKTTNPTGPDCDRRRVEAFCRPPLNYECGGLVVCETRPEREHKASLIEWRVRKAGRQTIKLPRTER